MICLIKILTAFVVDSVVIVVGDVVTVVGDTFTFVVSDVFTDVEGVVDELVVGPVQ